MALTLIGSPASPYVRKVRAMMVEAGIDDVAFQEVVTTALATDAAAKAANPLGRIPSLLRDDGPAIYDSRVITRYLDARAGSNLYPQARLWEMLTLEATAEGIMDSAVSISYELRLRPEGERSPAWIEAQWGKVASAVGVINDRWMSHLSGPVDMAQVATACALAYLDFRHDARGWRTGNDALAAWYAEFAKRPSMTETPPPSA